MTLSRTRIALLAVTLLGAARPGLAAPPNPAGTVRFQVQDRRDLREVSETTVLYVNGREVGTFRLDEARPEAVLAASLPAAPAYDYVLCGTIVLEGPDGVETHQVDSAGRLAEVDGHAFEALGASDFTLFYLADRADGLMPTQVHRGGSGLCATPTS